MTEFSIFSDDIQQCMLTYFSSESFVMIAVVENQFQQTFVFFRDIISLKYEPNSYSFAIETQGLLYKLRSLFVSQIVDEFFKACPELQISYAPKLPLLSCIQIFTAQSELAMLDFSTYPYFTITLGSKYLKFDQALSEIQISSKTQFILKQVKQQVQFTTERAKAMELAEQHLRIVSIARRLKTAEIMHDNQKINIDYEEILEGQKQHEPPVCKNTNPKQLLEQSLSKIEKTGKISDEIIKALTQQKKQETEKSTTRLSKVWNLVDASDSMSYYMIKSRAATSSQKPDDEYSSFSINSDILDTNQQIKEVELIKQPPIEKAMNIAKQKSYSKSDIMEAREYFEQQFEVFDGENFTVAQFNVLPSSQLMISIKYNNKAIQLQANEIKDNSDQNKRLERAYKSFSEQYEQKRIIFVIGWINDVIDGIAILLETVHFITFIENFCVAVHQISLE